MAINDEVFIAGVSVLLRVVLLAIWFAMASTHAAAEPSASARTEIDAAWKAADAVAIRGPAEIKLVDQGALKIGTGKAFIPSAEADRLMIAMGNTSDPARVGMIVGTGPKDNWLVDIDWTKEGFVRDGDAKEWEPDAMLDSLKEGTEAANEDRVKRGFPALELTGWIQPPTYDGTKNRLVWSLAARDKGAPSDRPQSVNYNTYALGREGYFSLDLVTGSDTIQADKQVAADLLTSLEYLPGKRYADFNGSTDKVAAYGLGALVGAVALKKMGLLAVAGVFFLKIWKLALLAIVGVGAAIRRWFKRESPPDNEA